MSRHAISRQNPSTIGHRLWGIETPPNLESKIIYKMTQIELN
jgi:hypothetical protein